jgi:hypothetical protein
MIVSRKGKSEYLAMARISEAVKTMQPDLREALLDAAEEALEPVDLEVGMNAALHQHAGAAHLERLGDLLVDHSKSRM